MKLCCQMCIYTNFVNVLCTYFWTVCWGWNQNYQITAVLRQLPKVYDLLCYTYVAQVRKHTDMQESHVFSVRFSHVHMFSDLHNVQKHET